MIVRNESSQLNLENTILTAVRADISNAGGDYTRS
jgi:hypothetical protein